MVARVLRSLGRLDEALAIQQVLRSDLKEDENDAYIEEELGECLLALGRSEDAKPHFAAAYAVLGQDDYLMKYESERLKRLKELAG
jgi:predicted negative regulator of RcsB-dependent stress response